MTIQKKQKKNKTIKKEEKKEDDEKAKNEYLEKENEKMEVMATEMHLSNELKHHIRETYNNEFKKRFQKILEKIESYQELGVAEYIETFKSNYGALKEEMAQILRDKEMEEEEEKRKKEEEEKKKREEEEKYNKMTPEEKLEEDNYKNYLN